MSVTLSSISDTRYQSEGQEDFELDSCPIYGRSSETLLLLKAYQEFRSTRSNKQKPKTIAVHGSSGSGKTALVERLREPVYGSHAFFCGGKYSQNQETQEPFSAIVAAFSDICDLVSQSEGFGETRKREIQQALGPHGSLLSKAVSSLSFFLAENSNQDRGLDMKDDTAFATFKIACKTFLGTMASVQRPIVMFIDDVQWMDAGSRKLLQAFHEDPELTNVLFILAYRDEEAKKLEGTFIIEEVGQRVVDIQLENLNVDSTHQIVSHVLGSNSLSVRELSKLVFGKTGGNPLHVLQFLETLKREKLVVVDKSSTACSFDIDHIQAEIMVAESLVDLLDRKIQLLPPAVTEVMKIASLMGFAFREDVLIEVASSTMYNNRKARRRGPLNSKASVKEALDTARREGIIERTSMGYRFRHDKLQASFQASYVKSEEDDTHRIIGETLMASQGGAYLYQAALHLNKSSVYVEDAAKRIQLVELNLKAAKHSQGQSAFEESASFLRKGLALLDSQGNSWDDYFDIMFDLTTSLSRMELANGNFEACKVMISRALEHAKTTEMKLDSLLLSIEVSLAANEISECVPIALSALKTIGIKISSRLSKAHVLAKLLKVRRMLRGKSDEDILALPKMTDRVMTTVGKILFHISSACILGGGREDLMVYAALMSCQATLDYGLFPYSALAFGYYGTAEILLGNHARGYRFGKLAMLIQDATVSKVSECATVAILYSFVIHWKEPVSGLRDHFSRAMERGVEIGDNVYGIYSASLCYTMGIMLGENLQVLDEAMRLTYNRMSDLSHSEGFLLWLPLQVQFVENLQTQEPDSWRDLTVLTGEAMNEAKFLGLVRKSGNIIFEVYCAMYKTMLAYHFGFYGLAGTLYCGILSSMPNAMRSHITVLELHTFGALSHCQLYRETRKGFHLEKFRSARKKLKQAQSIGCPNVSLQLRLLDAERLSLQRRVTVSTMRSAYRTVIEGFQQEELVHLEAIANERAAACMSSMNEVAISDVYLQRSLHLYKNDWGAHAKYEWLKATATPSTTASSDTLERSSRLLKNAGVPDSQPIPRRIQIE